MNSAQKIRFAFFGSSRLSVIVLDELEKFGLMPALIVTTPDKPQGRKLELKPNIVKEWSSKKSIPFLDPAKLDAEFVGALEKSVIEKKITVFIVASYGKIIPKAIIDIPERKSLNIHPSLLPEYRGPSPLPTTILDSNLHTGVTIMRMDDLMDHGPIVAQKKIELDPALHYEDFEELMAREGARLLAEVLPGWISGEIQEKEQDHAKATYTKKFDKEYALLDLEKDDPYWNFLRIKAFQGWLGAYFFIDVAGKKLRVKATHASFKDDTLIIDRVVPEGKKEMAYEDFLKGLKKA